MSFITIKRAALPLAHVDSPAKAVAFGKGVSTEALDKL
jgi:hypothetical protein